MVRELSGDKDGSLSPDIVGLVSGCLLSEDSADDSDCCDESDHTSDSEIIVLNESSVVGGCQGDKIIILVIESVFSDLVDVIVEWG